MPVSAADIQMLLVLEVGDTDSNALRLNVATIWDRYADKALIAPRLQELYTKRSLIDVALGEVRSHVDVALPDVKLSRDQETAHLMAMRGETENEITLVVLRAKVTRGGVVAVITAFEPVSPPTFGSLPSGPIDAGSPAYSGSPYVRSRGPQR